MRRGEEEKIVGVTLFKLQKGLPQHPLPKTYIVFSSPRRG